MNNELRDKAIAHLTDARRHFDQQQEAEPAGKAATYYAVALGNYVQFDANTGQLEIYETEEEAMLNCSTSMGVIAVDVRRHPPKPAAQPHWTDNHIKHESESGSWYAYDEVGLTYGTYETKDEARDALVIYEATQLHPAAQPGDIDAVELSHFIRKIDGNNSMGAGALAENIVEWLEKQVAQSQVPECSDQFSSVSDLKGEDGSLKASQGTVLIDSSGTRWIVMPSDDSYHLEGSVMMIGKNEGPKHVCRMNFPVVISQDDNY